MATYKNSGVLLVLLALLIFRKKKSNVNVSIEEPTGTQNINADYYVQIRGGAKLYSLDKSKVVGTVPNVQYFDGYNTNELPLWVKIKIPGQGMFYVTVGDFKILRNG